MAGGMRARTQTSSTSTKPLAFIAVGLAVALVAVGLFALWSAKVTDRAAYEAESLSIRQGLAERADRFGAELDAVAVSDSVATGIGSPPAAAIFQREVIAPLVARFGHDAVFLVEDGDVRFSFDSSLSSETPISGILELAGPALESIQRPITQLPQPGSPGRLGAVTARVAGWAEEEVIYRRETHLALTGGELLAISAATLVPATESGLMALRRGATRHLISVGRLSAARISEIGARFGHPELQFESSAPGRGKATVGLRDGAGRLIGHLTWKSRVPGSALMRAVAPFATALAIILMITIGMALIRVTQLQRALAQRQAVFRDVAESASDWIWQTDALHRFTEFTAQGDKELTQGGKHLLGLTRAELPVIEEDRPLIEAHMSTLHRRDPFRDLVYRVRKPDGSIRAIRTAGKPVFDKAGRFSGYRGTASDVTEEVMARQQSEEDRSLLNRALIMAGQGHWRNLKDSPDALWLSPELIKLLALEDSSGVGVFPRREIMDRYRGATPEALSQMAQQQWREADRAVFRVGFERGDGVEIVIEVQSYAGAMVGGKRRADHGIVRDVTEEVMAQRIIQQTNREIEERTRLLSRSMAIAGMGFWRSVSPQSDPIWLSQELCDLWGLDLAEGLDPLAIVQGCDVDDGGYIQHSAFRQTWATGLPRMAQSRFRRPNGEVIEIMVQLEAEFDEAGTVSGVTGVVRDITREQEVLRAFEDGRARLDVITAALQRAEEIAELGHWRLDLANGVMEGSPSASDVLGVPADRDFPMPIDLLARVPAADQEAFAAMLNNSLSQATASASVSYHHPQRGLRHMRFVIETEFGDDGHPVSVFGTVQDVTTQRANEEQLAARTVALNEAHEMGRIGDWSHRLGDAHIKWSPQIYSLLRLPLGGFEPTTANVIGLYLGEGRQLVLNSQAKVLRTGGVDSVDVQARLGDGSVGDFTVTSKADRDEKGQIIGFIGTIQDISDRKRSERELEKLAFYDPLTSLANRALFQRQITRVAEGCLNGAGSAALLLLDLDRFKEVNDSLGHAAGDELLLKVSQTLRRALPAEAMLARLGGDEFAVILPEADEDFAAACAETLVEELAKPFLLRMGEVNIGSSIGVAMVPKDGSSADELMRHGDLALYRAKDDGRGRARFFIPEFSELAQEKSRLARDLRLAIDAQDQLQLHFQPQVRMSDHAVTGFEALLRWRHPERGFVPPGEFIPIAESSTLIHDLGVWVLRESCRQMKAWMDAGEPRRTISVNVSAAQLWHTDFEEEVARALADTGLPADRLVIELTESVFVADGLARVKIALKKLKALGVRLALDDFGTGYSSLGYLNQLPFETLKIDRCFVRGIEDDLHKRELLKGIVALGQGLGMITVAEGAENEGELAALAEMGCNHVQGFVFARPTPAAEAVEAAARIERTGARVERAA